MQTCPALRNLAAPAAFTASATQRPYDPNHPYDAFKGTNIDPSQVVAPLVGPDGKQVTPPDALDKLSEKIKTLWGFASPSPLRPAYTPGISRRMKDRNEHTWRRDIGAICAEGCG